MVTLLPVRNRAHVTVNGSTSQPILLKFGVPQDSVLGAVLFVLYTQPLSQILSTPSVSHQILADDTQLQESGTSDQFDQIKSRLQSCICDAKK